MAEPKFARQPRVRRQAIASSCYLRHFTNVRRWRKVPSENQNQTEIDNVRSKRLRTILLAALLPVSAAAWAHDGKPEKLGNVSYVASK